MATTSSVFNSPSEAPPPTSVGAIGWVKQNLFGSVSDTLITLVLGYLLVAAVRSLINFFANEADWTVVTSNLTLFAIGRFPRDQAWRTIASLGVVVVLGASTVMFWSRNKTAQRILWPLWILSLPLIWVILSGFPKSDFLPEVPTHLWSGLLLTIMLAVVGIAVSFPIGLILALGRRSDLPIVKLLATVYIEAVRGVPLISVLFLAQVILPLFVGFEIDVVLRAMAALSLFFAAYLAEVIRGGLQAVSRGQIEAAQALGMSPMLVTGLVVLPQAIRVVIPAIVGTFISLLKDTTLVSIITLLDLLGITDAALSQNPAFQFHKMEAYLFIGTIYFVFSYVLATIARMIERATSAMGGTRQL